MPPAARRISFFKPEPRPVAKLLELGHRSWFLYGLAAIILLIILGTVTGGIANDAPGRLLASIKNAWTLDGHRAGTGPNEVLVLNEAGNISIKGHIATQGQLRSFARDGIMPIVVSSTTKVENLNVDAVDGFSSEQFTLAFVTKNGAVTTDNVQLRGDVAVGGVLEVKGATKLTDALLVDGGLGVWGDALFHDDLAVEGNVKVDQALEVGGKLAARGGVDTKGADISLGTGTIHTTTRRLVQNLNAELLQGKGLADLTLDLVTDNGAVTGNAITVGGLTVNGVSDLRGPATFSATAQFLGDLQAYGRTELWGETVLGNIQQLTVNGPTRLQQTQVQGSLNVSGNGIFSSLGVSGPLGANSLSGQQLAVAHTAVIGSSSGDELTVNSNTTFNGPVNFKKAVTASSNLTVLGTLQTARLVSPYAQTLSVAKAGADYTSIQAALDSVTSASTTKRYLVRVFPGDYNEAVTLKPYVDVVAEASEGVTTISQVDATVVTGADNATLSGFTVALTADTTGKSVVNLGASSATLEDIKITWAQDPAAGVITATGVAISTGSPELRRLNVNDVAYGLVHSGASGVTTIRDSRVTATVRDVDVGLAGGTVKSYYNKYLGSGTHLVSVAGATVESDQDSLSSTSLAGTTTSQTSLVGTLQPSTTRTYDLGTALSEFRQTYTQGLTVSDNTTLGDAGTDTVLVNANGITLAGSAPFINASNSSSTLLLNTVTNRPITTGTGLVTTGGALTATGLITGQLGLAVTGAPVSLNNNSNFDVSIATGTSTGNVGIGNPSAGAVTVVSGAGGILLNASNNQPTNINTGTSTGTVSIGNALANVAITDTQWSITGAGAASFVGVDATTGLLQGTGGLTLTGTVAINDNAGTSTTSIGAGTTTGAVTIGGTGTQTISVGNGGGVKTVNLGSNNTTSTTTILSGSGGLLINDGNSQPTNLNTGTNTGTITLGGTATPVNINTASSAATNLGTGTGNVGLGNATGTVGITSQNWGVSSSGAISGLTGYIQASGNFSISGTGTFATGTGAISLNGPTTVTGANTFATGTGVVTLNNVTTNISSANPVIDTTEAASTLNINTVTNRPVTFGSGNVTIPNLYVTNYEQNNGTFAIISTVPTGTIFSVTDNAITTGTLVGQNITANAGNGQTSYGQVINLTDATSGGGGYTALA
ncbi:MAG: hypothetical protein HY974_03440, partial [Candidatus Kerfeldbacteria bacterium]|nr:hypothetical protein [Candidatus Kerfeldbacteria bacterium]